MYNLSLFISIPVHCYGRFIRKFFDSVLKHEYCKFEFIILENCLNEDSIDVVESFKDLRLKLRKISIIDDILEIWLN